MMKKLAWLVWQSRVEISSLVTGNTEDFAVQHNTQLQEKARDVWIIYKLNKQEKNSVEKDESERHTVQYIAGFQLSFHIDKVLFRW